MCLHVSMYFVLADGSICVCIHVFLEFHTCITLLAHSVVSFHFSFHFLFVTALLLLQHSALCVLCNSYLLSMTMCILLILVPISF